jgi:hypothetical protein
MTRTIDTVINYLAYSATAPMARNARAVRVVISLLHRVWPEGATSNEVFPRAVPVVSADIST